MLPGENNAEITYIYIKAYNVRECPVSEIAVVVYNTVANAVVLGKSDSSPTFPFLVALKTFCEN